MANKKYTLYFKGKDNLGKIYDYPVVSLSLKEMDLYTSKYNNCVELYNSFAVEVKKYIESELSLGVDFESEKDLSKHIFIGNGELEPIINIIFKEYEEILCVQSKELINLLLDKIMAPSEFQLSLLNTKNNSNIKRKYLFFKHIYETSVKNKMISCMIDKYYVKRMFSNLDEDNLMIAAIATDKINLTVLIKKLTQTVESRRNLAYFYKSFFKEDLISKTDFIKRKKNL